MKYLLDENFPKSAQTLLEELGHEVIDIRGTVDEGADDERLFALAQAAMAVILTTDRDFYHTIPLQYNHHHGVIVIALKQPNRHAILERLRWALQQSFMDEMANTIVLLRDHTYRIRT